MSMDSSNSSVAEEIQDIFIKEDIESSEEPPPEEWDSLQYLLASYANAKQLLFEQGLYDPGSREICGKYITISDSSVLRHPYYAYPAVNDPGIKKALFSLPDTTSYPDDGQEQYLALCKEMNLCPVRIFHQSLLGKNINLRYYCVDPKGVKAMATALEHNRFVTAIDFTDNFLNNDACFHLSEMLGKNTTLADLDLSGCRIGPEGAKRLFEGLIRNKSLRSLNLNRNQLGDIGGVQFADAVSRGLQLTQIYLSCNQLGNDFATAFAEALEFKNTLTHIDLSCNNLFTPAGICNLLNRLEESNVLQMLNLSRNGLIGPHIGNAIKNAMRAPMLRELDLSSNRLQGEAVSNFVLSMSKAKKLMTLNLSSNPLDRADAVKVLSKMKLNAVKLQNLLMDNVNVDEQFMVILQQIRLMRQRAVITHGQVILTFKPTSCDPRELVMNRAEYLSTRSKKNKIDIALIFLQIAKENEEILPEKDFINLMKWSGAPLDADLVGEIVNVFAASKSKKCKTINLKLLTDYVARKWPDRKLPPTPPTEPEPEPIPVKDKKKDGMGKRKGKK